MGRLLIAVSALALSAGCCACAHAATPRHARHRHLDFYHSRAAMVGHATGPAAIDPRYPPVLQDQTPSYDDPSKLGGG